MSTSWQSEGEPLVATIEDAAERTMRVRVGEQVRVFRVLASAPGRHLVQEGETRLLLRVAAEGEGAWVRAAGATGVVRPAERVAPGRRRATGGAITPPMPGVVERMLVAAGDRVAAGATLVVVSAMKMEHALVAPRAGTVREVRVAVGDKVKPGELLVEINEGEDEPRAGEEAPDA